MRTVRTTMRPTEPIQVGDTEYLDLKRQGLLIEAPAAPATPPAPATTKKAATPAASKES